MKSELAFLALVSLLAVALQLLNTLPAPQVNSFLVAKANGLTEKNQVGGGRKPNIVFILMDNLGYGEVGCYGGGELRGAPTPRIDKLASEGTWLTNFNVEAQCTPSRSALMTGRLAIRLGTHSVPLPGTPDGLTQYEESGRINHRLIRMLQMKADIRPIRRIRINPWLFSTVHAKSQFAL